MTDTVLHLESKEKVKSLFDKVSERLEPDGKFILTFRDLTQELKELDRFILVKSDGDTIFTCFLEYGSETVKVHDIFYKRTDKAWHMMKSFYRNLRLSREWVEKELLDSGFYGIESSDENGFLAVVAIK